MVFINWLGKNDFGEIGNGTTENQTSPVKIESETGWKTIYPGESYTLGIKTDGSLWGWGCNDYGVMLDGITEGNCANVPVNIDSQNNWISILVNENGFDDYLAEQKQIFALNNDGKLFAWGMNVPIIYYCGGARCFSMGFDECNCVLGGGSDYRAKSYSTPVPVFADVSLKSIIFSTSGTMIMGITTENGLIALSDNWPNLPHL